MLRSTLVHLECETTAKVAQTKQQQQEQRDVLIGADDVTGGESIDVQQLGELLDEKRLHGLRNMIEIGEFRHVSIFSTEMYGCGGDP